MKILPQIALTIVIGMLGVGTISVIQSAEAKPPTPRHTLLVNHTETPVNEDLAKPLLNRVFTSGCTPDKGSYYRETLEFTANGTTRFSRNFFSDAACKDANQAASVREGRYALEPEESGHLLLMVRNLHGNKPGDSMPYFEALIQVDHDQLVLDNAPSPAQQYTAI